MIAAASIFQLGYSLMLIAVGAYGIFTAQWELAVVFQLDLQSFDSDAAATFLNQYRFLKSMELAFGLFCLLCRRSILGGSPLAIIFLLGCALGVSARLLAWVLDGHPGNIFLIFAVLEAITFVLVLMSIRKLPSARYV